MFCCFIAGRLVPKLRWGTRYPEAPPRDCVGTLLRYSPRRAWPYGDPRRSLGTSVVVVLFVFVSGGLAAAADHWAYAPLERPVLPEVVGEDRLLHPIDHFALARLEQENIAPSPEADRYTLIKRLHYDLIGLPPTPEEVDAFVEDASDRAYEELVDRLLASPHFGERWGRHWLDKARYADSDGYEKDNNRPEAWRYRDWVIDAINADMPYDEFIVKQTAGDLLPDASRADRLATAFHRQTLTNTEGGTDPEEWRVAAVMDRVETLGTVWLGLTIGCARCHDHKYDAISQDEYYRLFAFFNNSDEATMPLTDDGEDTGAKDEKEVTKVRVIAERRKDRRATHVLHRGDFLQPQHEVAPDALDVLPPIESRSEKGQSDRLDLANWLVDGHNPLPPRVIANDVWAHLFGEGLVRTMEDFGVRGEPPTHPDLLDWLAIELIDGGWSRKALIRTIVISSTYRQSSQHRPEYADVDPTNRVLYRQNRFRVEAEIVRDLHLAASGLLCRRIGGPSVYPPIPAGITDLTYNSSFKWPTSEGEDRYRRGMYTFFKRTAPHPNLITFDCPDSIKTNVQRGRSNTPIAALVTLNNEVFFEAAQAMASRVLTERQGTVRERLVYAFRLCVARPPDEGELASLQKLLGTSLAWYAGHTSEAEKLAGDCVVPQAGPIETAAWIATVRAVLNLDEFITRE